MPGIAKRTDCISHHQNDMNSCCLNPLMGNGKTTAFHFYNESPVSGDGFWSKHRDDVSYNQLEKFWCELNPQARHNLLRLDKHTLFEHARKNMYCSRCNGLLLEGFLQIVMYGKSIQHETEGVQSNGTAKNTQNDGELCNSDICQDDAQDPSVHPWGGLTTVRDGTLTLLDCYLYSKSLKELQNVFDSARARERERELLYPDACGGGGRGWISQGIIGNSRGHGTRETCALHTARLSVETLVDFWSALGEETRRSLLRMKEEDFIERLMYRFDSKKFCRDCRRNVIREFKELKELKRVKRKPCCTNWFCVADTAIQYEVSHDTVQADWHQTFQDAFGTFHHFEWAIGTGEGKSDILEFENVGLNGRVHVNGLDLSGLNACYITLRAWKIDGRCNEICVKAHALRGEQCVHCRLVVGDGFVTMSRGDSITRFFEHAEEAEEEEDDDSMDKDGNELDGECSRPQKHAKSPELAREFLLDAATVIFKEQVEKAFREGTARQNAHSIFVCLALKLLEERVYVACKEIITLEKQMKLLEEEENGKRKEEERKERKRTKEREKKLRRKERLREKDNREKKYADSKGNPISKELSVTSVDEGAHNVTIDDSVSERGEVTPSSPLSPDVQDDQRLTEDFYWNIESHSEAVEDGEFGNKGDWNASLPCDHLMYSRRKLKFRKDPHHDFSVKLSDRRNGLLTDNGSANAKYESKYPTAAASEFTNQLRISTAKPNARTVGAKLMGKFQSDGSRRDDRYDSFACSCDNHKYQARTGPVATRIVRQHKYIQKLEPALNVSKSYYHGCKHTPVEVNGRDKSKITAGNPANTKKVGEPLDSLKKHTWIGADFDATLRFISEANTSVSDQLLDSSGSTISDKFTNILVQTNDKVNDLGDATTNSSYCKDIVNVSHPTINPPKCPEEKVLENGEMCSAAGSREGISNPSISSSDNCSSCLSEGDSNTYSNPRNLESESSSDSEESSLIAGERDSHEQGFSESERIAEDQNTRGPATEVQWLPLSTEANIGDLPSKAAALNGSGNVNIDAYPRSVAPLQMHNQNLHFPVFRAPPTMGYYHQSPQGPWTPTNGFINFPYSSQYLLPNMFGYSLSASDAFMQYGAALAHMAPPVFTHAHLPFFQPVSHQVCTKEYTEVCVPHVGGGDTRCSSIVDSADQIPEAAPTIDKEVTSGWKYEEKMTNNGFSLFHFGGPVAPSTGYKLEPFQGKTGDTCLNSVSRCPDGEGPCCNKKDPIEEYNLFAASNGITFSLF